MEGELLYHTCFCRIDSTEYRNQIVSSNSLDPNIQIGEWQEHNHLILDAPIFSNGNSSYFRHGRNWQGCSLPISVQTSVFQSSRRKRVFFLLSFFPTSYLYKHSAPPFRTTMTINGANEHPHLCKSVNSVSSVSHHIFCLKLALVVKNINPDFTFLVRFSYFCNQN